jgi:sulfate permease, SulP family
MLSKFFPILQWLPQYKKSWLSGDLSAGVTVGIMLIPQGMAYAMIAGLPPVYGLYAALLPQVIYALLGTSRQLAVGPVAMDSLLVASGLGALSLSGINDYIAMAVFLSLFMGSIQLLLGLLKIGFLVNFLSRPVISGFTSAAAIIIGMSQLKHLLGTEIERSNQIHILLQNAWPTLENTNFITLAIGLSAIVIIKLTKKFIPRVPGALAVVVIGVLVVYFGRLHEMGVNIVGMVPQGLPSFSLPVVETSRISELTPIALTLALIAFMEAISVAKAVEERHNEYEVNANQELVALGASNIVGSLFQSYPTTGGFSRTAVNDQAGAKTGISPLISAIIVGLTLLFLTPLFYYLPKAVLAAIIMVAVFGLIDVKYPKSLFGQRKDEFILLVATFIITLTIGITQGIFTGVLISLVLLLYRVSRPHIAILGKVKGTEYYRNINRFSNDTEQFPGLLIVRFDAQLFFGNAEFFRKEMLKAIANNGPETKAVILDALPINYIDSSAAHQLKQLVEELKSRGITFLIARVIGPARDIIYHSDLHEVIDEQNMFASINEAVNCFREGKPRMPVSTRVASAPGNTSSVT